MKEDALQKGLPVPDEEAAIRERVPRKDVEAPRTRYFERLLPLSSAASKGMI
jgi:hypothetical protein